jgi:hypothetical protein
MANLPESSALLFESQFSWEIGAISCKSMQEEDDIRIYTL